MFNQLSQFGNRLVNGNSANGYDPVPSGNSMQIGTSADIVDKEAGPRTTPRNRQRGSSLAANAVDAPVLLVGTQTDVDTSADPRFASVLGTIKQHASDFNLQGLANSVQDMQQRTALHVQTRFPMLGPPFWACVFYSIISTSMILVNKLLLSTYGFKYPMVLLFHQSLMTVNSLYIAKEMGITTYEPLDSQRVVRWLPMDVFFVIMLLTSFYSVQLLSVPMVTIFKNTNNIFIAVGDALVYQNIPSPGVVWTMLLMLLAAVMAALNDLEYTFVGYMWTLANCLASTCFVLYAQSAIAKTNLSTFGKVYYNNVLALPLVLLADIFVFGDFQRLFSEDSATIWQFFSVDFIFLWFVSGVLGFLQSLSSLRAQHLTSPTTYSMVGSLNKIPLTLIGVWIFHSPMTAKGILYVSLSIIAGALYSYSKAKEDIAARAEKQAKDAEDARRQKAAEGHGGAALGELTANASNLALEGVSSGTGTRTHHRHKGNPRNKSLPSPAVDADQVVGGSGLQHHSSGPVPASGGRA